MTTLKSLFFIIFSVSILSCKTSQPEIKPQVYTSWDKGFLLQYRSFQIGELNYSSKSDPLFTSPIVQERLIKEIKFNFESKDLKYIPLKGDILIYPFFIGANLQTPILPYEMASATLKSNLFEISVDTLTANQHVLVLDIVDLGTNQLVWRAYSKITTFPQERFLNEITHIMQEIAKNYPN